MFTLIIAETVRPINSQGLEFLSDLGRCISQVSDDVCESATSVLIPGFDLVTVQGSFAHTPTNGKF